jgi:prepilin-type N-terminal cleavage/methylation domain-containing protein
MNNTKGFSLLEIVVGISIIGILSVLAVPSYLTYIDKAKQVVVDDAKYTSKKILSLKKASDEDVASCADLGNYAGLDTSITVTGDISTSCIFEQGGMSSKLLTSSNETDDIEVTQFLPTSTE